MSRPNCCSGLPAALALCVFAALVGAGSSGLLQMTLADDLRVFEPDQRPNDARLGKLKDLNGYFPFQVPNSREAWQRRAANLRRRVLVATGLWPMPERTPLNAVIHGKVERDGFTVEKVYFESVPNHFVTGLLFRPSPKSRAEQPARQENRYPAVLCPHGHGGRLQDYGEQKLRELIARGEERFERSGRFPKLARCAHLARMGCVVFIFDMLGYADSQQISYELAHRFAKQRAEFEGESDWGLYSAQAEMRLQSIMGIQTWNGVRCLDFLESLPDVDPTRIGVTGGSGGGTQTILLGAIDDRPVAAFPNGMVSTSMQGGCTCENCALLRIGTGNVELAALFAPRPQGMTAADDWTRDMMTHGFPQLRQLYKMLGAPQDVACHSLLHFPHNYNYVTRGLMYAWFNKHLGLGLEDPVLEEDFEPLSDAENAVWDAKHPKPAGGDAYERQLIRYLTREADRQLTALTPTRPEDWRQYVHVVGGAWQTIIGRTLPEAGEIQRTNRIKDARDGYLLFKDVLRLTSHQEELPVISLFPTRTPWNEEVVIWIDGQGKGGLFDASRRPNQYVMKLLAAGTAVTSADLFEQGEFVAGIGTAPTPSAMQRVVENPREAAAFSFGYNHTQFARRAHDILTLVAFAKSYERRPKRIHLLGVNGAGPVTAAARAVLGDTIHHTGIDSQAFRFARIRSYREPNFLPGAVKYGDLPGLLSLAAPHSLLVVGESDLPEIVERCYVASGGAIPRASAGSVQELVDFVMP